MCTRDILASFPGFLRSVCVILQAIKAGWRPGNEARDTEARYASRSYIHQQVVTIQPPGSEQGGTESGRGKTGVG